MVQCRVHPSQGRDVRRKADGKLQEKTKNKGEMKTEEKAKAYDEALERARKELKQDLHESGIWAIQRIFPELKESEDEKIRKELKEAFEAYDIDSTWNGIPIRSILTWIEKQKELKQEWSEEDENALKYFHELISFGFTEKFFDAQTAADMREWLNTRLKAIKED